MSLDRYERFFELQRNLTLAAYRIAYPTRGKADRPIVLIDLRGGQRFTRTLTLDEALVAVLRG